MIDDVRRRRRSQRAPRPRIARRAGLVRFIGLAEVAAAVGLVIGLFWQPLGIAAAIGLVVTMIGAVGYHAKAGDYADPATRNNALSPIAFLLLAVAAAVMLGLAM